MTSILSDFRDKVELQILRMSDKLKNLASKSPFHVLVCIGLIVIFDSIKGDGSVSLNEIITVLGLDAVGNFIHDLQNKNEDEIIKLVKESSNEIKSQLAILIEKTNIDEIYCQLNPLEKTWFKNTLNNELSDFFSTGLCKEISKSTTDKTIKRYITNKEKGHIYTDLNRFHELHEITEINNRCIIMGNAGYGKTFLGMAFAEFLQNNFSFTKVLYINMEEISSINSLILDIKTHLLDDNTVFIFDNCRDKFEIVNAYENRLGELVYSSRKHIVNIYISRISAVLASISKNAISEELHFFDPEEVYFIKDTRQIIQDIIKSQFPKLHSSDEKHIDFIDSLCGGDLFLLNCILPEINSPNDVYEYNKERIFKIIIDRYFAKSKDYSIRSPIHKISAIARFDILPVARYFEIDSRVEKSKIFSDLIYLVDTRPPKFHFIHSSMAELVFQSLIFSEGIEDENYISIEFVVEYLEKLKERKNLFVETLIKLSSQDLRPISSVEEQNLLLSNLLAENVVLDNIKENFSLYPLNFLLKITIFQKQHNLENYEIYYGLIRDRILDNSVRGMLLSQTYLEKNIFIIEFKELFPDLYSLLLNHLIEYFDKFISEINSFYDLLMILILISNRREKELEDDFSSLDSSYFRNLVRNTIKNKFPIWHFAAILHKFKKINPRLQSSIEEKTNPEGYISLACELGTMTELLNIINNSSPGMQKAIVTSLEAETINRLIEKSIDQKISIGIHALILRQINHNPDILKDLEELIGAGGYLSLIIELGSIPELFGILRNFSQKMQKAMINSLDEEIMQKLLKNTIEKRKSIGTINFSIRDLNSNKEALEALENLIGADGYLSLIIELGSIPELFGILHYSSPRMQKALINSLDEEIMQKLIKNTIEKRKSIGTIDFSIRDLSSNEEALEALENLIGADGYIHLILELGYILDLFRIISHSSQKMQKALVNSLDEETMKKLIGKTIKSQKSIGALAIQIRSLSDDTQLIETFERLIGIDGYLNLIRELGTIKIIIKLLETSSNNIKRDLVKKLVETFTINDWQKQFENLLLKDYLKIIKYYGSYLLNFNFDNDFIRQMIDRSLNKADIDEIPEFYLAVRNLEDNDLKEIFLETTRHFIDNIGNEFILDLDYEKKLSMIQLFLNFSQERYEPKIKQIIELLPPADILFGEKNILKRIRYMLETIAKHNFAIDVKTEILKICNSTPVVNCIEKSSNLEIFLFLWNLYCVWEKNNLNNTDLFCNFLNHKITNSVMESIDKNIQEDSDVIIYTIALIGFLTYMQIAIPNDLRNDLGDSITLDQSLLRKIGERTYLFNVLCLISLENIKNSTIEKQFWIDAHQKILLYDNLRNPGLVKLSKYSSLRAENILSEF